MVALSQGGSADDIAPGVEFFRKLKQAGNFLPVDPTPATIESGQTPGGHRLELPQRRRDQEAAAAGRSWCRRTHAVAGYYYQAINKDAPHPAAARLWQEFLYSDEGQNLFAQGGVRPVRADNMIADGTARRGRRAPRCRSSTDR